MGSSLLLTHVNSWGALVKSAPLVFFEKFNGAPKKYRDFRYAPTSRGQKPKKRGKRKEQRGKGRDPRKNIGISATLHPEKTGSPLRYDKQGTETEEKRKEERAKGKGPRLNSLRSFSSKNLTGQAGIRDQRSGVGDQGSGLQVTKVI